MYNKIYASHCCRTIFSIFIMNYFPTYAGYPKCRTNHSCQEYTWINIITCFVILNSKQCNVISYTIYEKEVSCLFSNCNKWFIPRLLTSVDGIFFLNVSKKFDETHQTSLLTEVLKSIIIQRFQTCRCHNSTKIVDL